MKKQFIRSTAPCGTHDIYGAVRWGFDVGLASDVVDYDAVFARFDTLEIGEVIFDECDHTWERIA